MDNIQKQFEIERNAKNKAYHFIIASGNFEAFLQFCKTHKGNDYREVVKALLVER